MTTTGLAAPRAAPRRVLRRDPEPPPPAETPPRRRDSFGRVMGWSLGLSALAHLLLLLVSPIFIQTEQPPGGPTSIIPDVAPQFGLEMIVAIPSENAPELPEISPAEEVDRPTFVQPLQPPQAGGQPQAGAVPTNPSPAGAVPSTTPGDALRPGTRDPRLYVRPNPLPNLDTRTDYERYMDRIEARIDALNDSMGIAAARNRTTSDWTFTDADGNRWGLSPDGLHLGGVTIPRELIPLPGPTGDNQSLEAARERQRQRDEIIRQEADRERRETQQERIDATRQRQN